MPVLPSRSSVRIDIGEATKTEAVAVLDPDMPFRILVAGNFRGDAGANSRGPLESRRTLRIDCDNFEDVMRQLEVRLELPRACLRFHELDDFHPDRIYRAAPVFEELANLRPAPKAMQAPASGLLDAIIGEAQPETPRWQDAGDLAAFIDRVTAKHLEARPDAAEQSWNARLQLASSELMSALLHHPRFQKLEASWRSLWMMMMRLGAEEGIEISLLDLSPEEMADQSDAVARLISLTGVPWGAIIFDAAFGQTAEDARRLAALGAAARGAGGSLLAEAEPPARDESPEWHQLRHSVEARWIGLALPRFLVRLPYGRSTSPLESMPYEEMPASNHAHYLWGNPAYCAATLLGLAFRENGWSMRPGMIRRLDNMPLHLYQRDGESVSKPCAEVLLSESEAEQLIQLGLMPVASLKDQDALLIVRFCSLADPLSAIQGRWN